MDETAGRTASTLLRRRLPQPVGSVRPHFTSGLVRFRYRPEQDQARNWSSASFNKSERRTASMGRSSRWYSPAAWLTSSMNPRTVICCCSYWPVRGTPTILTRTGTDTTASTATRRLPRFRMLNWQLPCTVCCCPRSRRRADSSGGSAVRNRSKMHALSPGTATRRGDWSWSITADDGQQQWTVTGQFARGDEILPLSSIVAADPSGLLLSTTKLSFFETNFPAAWIGWLFQQQTPPTVPYADRDEFLRQLWNAPGLPGVAWPENLALQPICEPPQPRLRVREDKRTPHTRLTCAPMSRFSMARQWSSPIPCGGILRARKQRRPPHARAHARLGC